MSSSPSSNPLISFDALLPPEMAAKAEQVGLNKVKIDPLRLLALAVLAGAFISLGAIFATNTLVGGEALPYGVQRLLAGLTFSLGLILVVVGGAELFTGNVLIIMAFANRRLRVRDLLYNWTIVYTGNLLGALGTAVLLFLSNQFLLARGQVGLTALQIAQAKCSLSFGAAVFLGVLCNVLVCLAVWLCFSARTTSDKILAIIPPITAFVACGFEHSIANMYFIPIGLFLKAAAPASFWDLVGRQAGDFAQLTWSNFLWANLIPVTLGNLLGGAFLVGLVYWFVYLRPGRAAAHSGPAPSA